MKVDLSGKVAVVTGGTAGIGRAAAVALAAAGARVIVAGRREREGESVVAEIAAAGGTARFVRADVTDEAQVRAMVDAAVTHFGGLHVAVNNAGVLSAPGLPATGSTVAEYRRVLDTNVLGVVLGMKYQLAAMLASGGGSIVNNASILGLIGLPGSSLYIASKHAVIGLTRAAALENARQGIRVNAVAPGAVQTDMIDTLTQGGNPAIVDGVVRMHPIGRMGRPREIADAVVWLASDQASFVTGAVLPVDGGFTAQ